MTPSQTKMFKKQLISLRDQLSREDTDLRNDAMQPIGGEASGGLSNVPIHNADMGTQEAQEDMALRLMENAEATLGEVQAALERIEQGKYGRCEDCGKPIPIQRLKSVPYARRCVEHESQHERESA